MFALAVLRESDPDIRKFRTYWDGAVQDVLLHNAKIYKQEQTFHFYQRLDAYDFALALSHEYATLITVDEHSDYTVWAHHWKQLSCLIKLDFRDFA